MKRIPATLILLVVCLAVDVVALLWQTVALIAGSPRGWRLAIAHDQLGNVMAGGDEDEVFSARCWRERHRLPYRWLVVAIDAVAGWLGDPDHCRKAFDAEHVKAVTRAGWRFREGN